MQQNYGNEPFIIENHKASAKKSRSTVNVGVNKRFVFVLVILSIVAISLAVYFTLDKVYSFSIPGKNYYAVRFYYGTSLMEAELVASELKESNGSGYIVNDGKFSVYGSIYKSRSEAENVLNKQAENAEIVVFAWKEKKFDSRKDEESKLIKESLIYFNNTLDILVEMSVNLDIYAESDASVCMYMNNVLKNMENYAKDISNTQVKVLFDNSVMAINTSFFVTNERSVSSKLKYVINDMISCRIDLFVS